VLRRQGPGTKEVSKFQQGCLESRETEAVEVAFDMSVTLSKGPLADRPRGGKVQQGCLAGETGHAEVVRRVCSK
jgi:hypothetical protein